MMSNDGLTGGPNRAKAFTQGVIIDTLRGPHSTGLVYTDNDGSVEIYKKPIPGYDFVNMPKFASVLNDPEDHPFMIAHNRYATKGKVNTANAHPFQHKHITGVHNGSLWTWKPLSPEENFETDSEYIFHALANTDDVGEVIKKIDGAFALVWHDSRDNTMHICRNDEREFWLAHVKGKQTVLGASEKEMLELMFARNNLDIEELYLVNNGHELIFKLDDLHNPEVIERQMMEYWGGYNQAKKPTVPSAMGGGRNTNNNGLYLLPSQGKIVQGIFCDFVKYPGNTYYGYIEAITLDEEYKAIRINGITEQEVKAMDMKDEFFESTVLSDAVLPNGEEYFIMSKENLKWLTTNEMYQGTEDDTKDLDTYTKSGRGICYAESEASKMLANGCCTCGDPIPLLDFEELDWWNGEPICLACKETQQEQMLGI